MPSPERDVCGDCGHYRNCHRKGTGECEGGGPDVGCWCEVFVKNKTCTCGHLQHRHLNHGMGCAELDANGDFCDCHRFEEDVDGKAEKARAKRSEESIKRLQSVVKSGQLSLLKSSLLAIGSPSERIKAFEEIGVCRICLKDVNGQRSHKCL